MVQMASSPADDASPVLPAILRTVAATFAPLLFADPTQCGPTIRRRCPVPVSSVPASQVTLSLPGIRPCVVAQLFRTDDGGPPSFARLYRTHDVEALGHGPAPCGAAASRLGDIADVAGLDDAPPCPSWFLPLLAPLCPGPGSSSPGDLPLEAAPGAQGPAACLDSALRVYARAELALPGTRTRDYALRVSDVEALDAPQRAALGCESPEAFACAWVPDTTVPAFRAYVRGASIGMVLIEGGDAGTHVTLTILSEIGVCDVVSRVASLHLDPTLESAHLGRLARDVNAALTDVERNASTGEWRSAALLAKTRAVAGAFHTAAAKHCCTIA